MSIGAKFERQRNSKVNEKILEATARPFFDHAYFHFVDPSNYKYIEIFKEKHTFGQVFQIFWWKFFCLKNLENDVIY